jgi:hypothetical protein
MTDQLPITSFALYAESDLCLGPDSQVRGGHIGVRSRAGQSDGGQLGAGDGFAIEPEHNIISPSVLLGREVSCGPVLADALTDHGIPLRPTDPFPFLAVPPLPLAAAPAAGTEAVGVAEGQVASLAPGSYAALTVHGSLVLNPGEYVFASVTIGHGATVASVGDVRITVLSYLTTGRDARLHPLFGQPASQLMISVAGTDTSVPSGVPSDRGNSGGEAGTTLLPAASFGERAELRALLNAPHGTVALADRTIVQGAVAGFAIRAGECVEVCHEGGFPAQQDGQQGSQQLAGAYGVPAGPGIDPVAGPVPAGTGISLAIGLPVRNAEALQSLIRDVSDPKSPRFRQHISSPTFNAAYGATASDYQALKDWAAAAGFTTIATFPSNLLLRVTATAAQVQQALFVNLVYRTRSDGSQYVATDRELSLDLTVPVLQITGLGDAVLPVRYAQNGTGTGQSYRAADLRTAYLGVGSATPGLGSPLQSLDGTGQHIGIVNFTSFVPSDLAGYAGNQLPAPGQPTPLPAPNVAVVQVESPPPFTVSTSAADTREADVDAELAYAMAPNAVISVFQGTIGITDQLDAILYAMADFSPQLTCASSSLGFAQGDNAQQALDKMAAQGVSFFQASGDSGDVGNGDILGSVFGINGVGGNLKMRSQTLVGGTILATNPLADTTAGPATGYPDPYHAGEFAWPNSGGGVMTDTDIPYWQTGLMELSAGANGGSLGNRNYPDVAILAVGVEIYYSGSATSVYGGTSMGAPLWAGFTALINQLSAQNGGGLMGFLNPTLYDIGLTRGQSGGADLYAVCFNDIADNVSNGIGKGGSGYRAVAGYDLVTGLGSPKPGLITQLASATPTTPAQFSLIRFIIGTGTDGLRSDSAAFATVFLKNGGKFNVTLKPNGEPQWDAGTQGPLDFAIPADVTAPTPTQALSGVQITMLEDPQGAEGDDNWDITTLQVSLFNPGSEQLCQLNLVGNAELKDDHIGLVRLSGSIGDSGSGPASPVYVTGPGSGC